MGISDDQSGLGTALIKSDKAYFIHFHHAASVSLKENAGFLNVFGYFYK